MAKSSGATKSSTSRTPKGMTRTGLNTPRNASQAQASYESARTRAGKALREGREKEYYIASAESQYYQAMRDKFSLEKQFPTGSLDAHKDQTTPIIEERAKKWKEKVKRLRSASSGFEKIYNG